MAIAMWLLSLMDVNTPAWQTGVFIAVLGLGMGFLMQTTMLIAQNSVEQKDLGVASSASTFFRSIGGSFGVSLFGAVFNNHLTSSLDGQAGPRPGEKLATGGGQFNPAAMQQLPAERADSASWSRWPASISSVFWWAILFAVLVPLLAAFIQGDPAARRLRQGGGAAPPSRPSNDRVSDSAVAAAGARQAGPVPRRGVPGPSPAPSHISAGCKWRRHHGAHDDNRIRRRVCDPAAPAGRRAGNPRVDLALRHPGDRQGRHDPGRRHRRAERTGLRQGDRRLGRP